MRLTAGILHNMYNNKPSCPPPHRKPEVEYAAELSLKSLKEIFASCADFESRTVYYGLDENFRVQICWLDGIVSGGDLGEDILRPLTQAGRAGEPVTEEECMERIISGAVYSYSVKKRDKLDDVVADLTHGHCALIFEGTSKALCFEIRSNQTRSISEPSLEKSLKGAKDSFVETLRVNTALVRRRICSPKLKLIQSTVGRKSNTTVAIMFVDGIAAPDTVEELARRLDALDIDALLSTGSLEDYIVDAPNSPFPQLIHTERPDRFAMHLADGRVGLLVDGLPVGLLLPVTFSEFMKVTSDSNTNFIVSSFLTVLRYFALMLGLFLPAAYVAIAMYHQEMLPTKMLLSIVEAKQNVPFSTAVEIIGMILAFMLLQEASLRLPNPIGDTVSIIGALIVGQSAVEAQIVSPIAIIVVALAGIACYTLPSQDMGSAVRLVQMGMLIAAIAAGLFGMAALSCLILLKLADMDSFGVNYTAPVTGSQPWGLARLLLRLPKPMRKYRDALLRTPDRRRQK